MKIHLYVVLTFLVFTASAFADVTIGRPSNGETVSSPFSLSADAASCSSQPTRSIGYSLDDSHDTTIVKGASLDLRLTSSTGMHKVHVKAWGYNGAVCVAEVAITVSSVAGNAAAENSLVPADAIPSSHLERLPNWIAAHDRTSDGGSSGKMRMVDSPSRSGTAREFTTTYTDSGDERYAVFFGSDPAAHSFLYDAWVYLTSSASQIANLELDVNQTMSNRETVILGIQCDGYHGTWDYSENKGTPSKPAGDWVHTKAACDVRKWSTNEWHHVQMSYSRDDSGRITYKSVYLDGVESPLNATVLGARALGWRPNLSTNFQIDGRGKRGTITVYLDNLTIYRW
ncbi:MAG: hypothetical protein ABI076_07550 [Acidobacteriaceae bacterium]